MSNQRRPKKKAGMGYFMILLLILIVFAAAGVFVSKRFAPSKAQANLEAYYNLTASESSNRLAAESNEYAIVIDENILDNEAGAFRAIESSGHLYIGLSLLQKYVDGRFFYDSVENLLLFTDAATNYACEIGSTVLSANEQSQEQGYVIAQTIGSEIYVALDFAKAHTKAVYNVLTGPNRLYIRTITGTHDFVTARSDVKMRTSDSKKASILTEIPEGSDLRVLSSDEGWYKVVDDNGYIGYVQGNFLTDEFQAELSYDFTEPEYTHITLDGPVNMVWHGIYYYESNQYLPDYTAQMTGVNVLAPTWFLFSDEEGNILSYADADYVSYAHEHGWQVWAVLEDLDGYASPENLATTSRRRNAISQMINECFTYGIDGINVDLETVTTADGGNFIQFVRELSVACRANNIILSVDDYAPYSYNAYRHTAEQSKLADYVAIMTYDDYVGTGTAGPNSGLPFVEEVMGLCENTVDMSRLIVGLPFYTRIWYENGDGSVSADTVDINGIENLIWEHGLTFEWLDDVGYEYTQFESNGSTVKIWRENAASMEAKLKLISEYNVAGVACWRLGQESSDMWAVLEKYYK